MSTSLSFYQSEEKPKKKKSPKEKSSSSSGANTESGANNKAGADEPEKAADEWVEIEEKADTDYSGNPAPMNQKKQPMNGSKLREKMIQTTEVSWS